MSGADYVPAGEVKRRARRKPAGGGEGNGTPPVDETTDRQVAVEELNKENAAILIGSRCMILRERPDRPPYERLQLISVEAFHQWMAPETALVTRRVKTRDGGEEWKTEPVPKSKIWMASPARRSYSGMVFAPGEPPVVDGAHNLWRGFEVARNPDGDCSLFLDHVGRIVAGGNSVVFRYVMAWFAHMMQRPRERIGVALALRGGQGVGKTIIGKIVGALIEANYILIDNPRYLTGQFNAHLRGCLLLQADEGFWAGDKTAEGQLKGLITSDVQMLEHKGVDPIRMQNYVRLLVTSNEQWVIPAGLDERRWAIVDVAPHKQQDTEYFQKLDEQMADPANLGALLDYLLSFDLSTVDLRQPPATGGLYEQKVHSFDSFASWWHSRLMEGVQLPGEPEWLDRVPTHRVYASYIADAERVGTRRRLTLPAFGIALRDWLTMPGQKYPLDGFDHRRGKVEWDNDTGKSTRPYDYYFPPLAAARAVFEARIRQDVEWLVTEADESC